ncbi:glycosyltransferase family 9 protein [Dyadobacter crusticola]|uniref:glycosyltransferase family 9 protein n=1 Tax=Dyadobacter crusticola TaxID=292407 RepID=UPI00068FF855|nr:glycosyltransferase family 9 protein [Dyadobacter crusticola]
MSEEVQQNAAERWFELMLHGELEEVWKISDEGLKARAGKSEHHLPRHLQHIWQGGSLADKRVLVRCYHGLGDTIQFIRYAPLIKDIAKEVIVWAQPALIPLLERSAGIDKLLPLHDGIPEVEYDVDIEIMECQHIFRTTLARIPREVPYIFVQAKHLPRPEGNLAVGLIWKSGGWDARRDVPFELLKSLFDVPGITIFIMQADAAAAGWEEGFGNCPGAFEVPAYAAVLKGLDLVISVDSMPVHLAGALGVPVWNLLHAHADWRWMKDREDSPWYPTMRIFRQESAGEWEPVIEKVTAELTKLSGRSVANTVS